MVELNQLVELPTEFLLQPRQVAEAYVCRIRPNDCDRDFSPQVCVCVSVYVCACVCVYVNTCVFGQV